MNAETLRQRIEREAMERLTCIYEARLKQSNQKAYQLTEADVYGQTHGK